MAIEDASGRVPDHELLAMASAFDLIPFDPGRPGIRMVRLESRNVAGRPPSWAITNDMGSVLARDGYWEPEGLPSGRTEEFLLRCRWDDLHQAISFARAHMTLYPSGYMPEPGPDNQQGK